MLTGLLGPAHNRASPPGAAALASGKMVPTPLLHKVDPQAKPINAPSWGGPMKAKVALAASLSLFLLLSTAAGCFDSATEVEATGNSLAAQGSSPPVGLYRAAPDHTLAIHRSSRGSLTLTDFKTGMHRGLAPKGDGVYSIGPGLGVTEPALFRLTVQRDAGGRVQSLLLEPAAPAAGGSSFAALPLTALPCCPFRAEQYEFESEGLRLVGTLYVPATRGPHSTVVWVHGSGPVTRWSAGSWPLFMLGQGFAVLAVDKRGVGESEGSYRLADGSRDNLPHMRRRSLDVAAAVRSLAAHPDVDAERIGLIGGSQAGWVMPMVAKLGEVAFTITISGGATPIDVEGRFSELAGENTDGGSNLTIDEVYRQLRRYRPRGFDFREEFAAQDSPGLWLYGDNDRVNPTQLAVEVIEEVRDTFAKDFTVIRWPDGNHSLQVSETGDIPEMRRLGLLVPGLHETVHRWLADRGFVSGN